MAIIVQKYGGSSVATPEKILAVADRIVAARTAGDLPVVVVSAMGGSTDELLGLARAISPHPHRRELDMLLTVGERISMALLAMAIRDRGHEAVSFTGSQAGIITTADHNQAHIIEVRPLRVQEALGQGRIVIVGGFAGVSTTKEVTTLGRGGSDTTAIALAAALDARSCCIYSDVDGVYTADPRVVEDAQRIDRLSHGEVLEMGLRGATVLAPAAIDYARRHGIELRAAATFAEGGGTVITSRPAPGAGRAVAVTADRDALPATLQAPTADAVARALDRLAALGLRWKDARRETRAGGLVCELVLDMLNTPDATRLLADEADAFAAIGCGLSLRPDAATVTVVGEGIAEQPTAWAIATRTLAALGVEARVLTSSPFGLTVEVPRASLVDVLRGFHAAFPGLARVP